MTTAQPDWIRFKAESLGRHSNFWRFDKQTTIKKLESFIERTRREAKEEERERILNLANGLTLEPENLKKQIEDFEKLLSLFEGEKS